MIAQIAARIRAQGAAEAVLDGTTCLDYAELGRLAGRVASGLREAGYGGGDLVGVLLERDTHLPTALLGVHAAGSGLCPLGRGPARQAPAIPGG